jgi:hypothetical protein
MSAGQEFHGCTGYHEAVGRRRGNEPIAAGEFLST